MFVFVWLTSLSIIISRSIHVAANGSIPFFFNGWQYSVVYAHHIFFICSPVDGHLGCLHVSAMASNVAVNVRMHVPLQIGVS